MSQRINSPTLNASESQSRPATGAAGTEVPVNGMTPGLEGEWNPSTGSTRTGRSLSDDPATSTANQPTPATTANQPNPATRADLLEFQRTLAQRFRDARSETDVSSSEAPLTLDSFIAKVQADIERNRAAKEARASKPRHPRRDKEEKLEAIRSKRNRDGLRLAPSFGDDAPIPMHHSSGFNFEGVTGYKEPSSKDSASQTRRNGRLSQLYQLASKKANNLSKEEVQILLDKERQANRDAQAQINRLSQASEVATLYKESYHQKDEECKRLQRELAELRGDYDILRKKMRHSEGEATSYVVDQNIKLRRDLHNMKIKVALLELREEKHIAQKLKLSQMASTNRKELQESALRHMRTHSQLSAEKTNVRLIQCKYMQLEDQLLQLSDKLITAEMSLGAEKRNRDSLVKSLTDTEAAAIEREGTLINRFNSNIAFYSHLLNENTARLNRKLAKKEQDCDAYRTVIKNYMRKEEMYKLRKQWLREADETIKDLSRNSTDILSNWNRLEREKASLKTMIAELVAELEARNKELEAYGAYAHRADSVCRLYRDYLHSSTEFDMMSIVIIMLIRHEDADPFFNDFNLVNMNYEDFTRMLFAFEVYFKRVMDLAPHAYVNAEHPLVVGGRVRPLVTPADTIQWLRQEDPQFLNTLFDSYNDLREEARGHLAEQEAMGVLEPTPHPVFEYPPYELYSDIRDILLDETLRMHDELVPPAPVAREQVQQVVHEHIPPNDVPLLPLLESDIDEDEHQDLLERHELN